MKPPRIALLALLAGCGLGAMAMWRVGYNRTAALEGQVAQLKAENAKLDSNVAAATGQARALDSESTQFRAAPAISGIRLEPDPAPTPAQEEDQPKERGGFLTKMFKDPQMRKLLATQQAAALRGIYSDYLKEANLTPDETERFLQLLQERQMALMDSSTRALSGGDVDMKSATAATNATDDALEDLLGPARFGQYREFEKTLGPRVEVQQFNLQLAGDGYPLQDDQSGALVRIISQETAAMPGFGAAGQQAIEMSPADIDRYSQQVEAVNRRIYTRAMAVLTPPQLGAFAAFQKNLATSQVAGLKMAQQMLNEPSPTMSGS